MISYAWHKLSITVSERSPRTVTYHNFFPLFSILHYTYNIISRNISILYFYLPYFDVSNNDLFSRNTIVLSLTIKESLDTLYHKGFGWAAFVSALFAEGDLNLDFDVLHMYESYIATFPFYLTGTITVTSRFPSFSRWPNLITYWFDQVSQSVYIMLCCVVLYISLWGHGCAPSPDRFCVVTNIILGREMVFWFHISRRYICWLHQRIPHCLYF